MNLPIVFTSYAEEASMRYEILVGAWRAIFTNALKASNFGSQQQYNRVLAEASDLARRFVWSEEAQINRVMIDIALEAQGATQKQIGVTVADKLTDQALTHLNDAQTYLLSEITVQVERDVNMLLQALKKAALQINLSARSRGVSNRTALVEYMLSTSLDLQFFFHDRGNQKWPSRKFIRSVWRHSLLSLYNEIVLITLADHKIDKAFVWHTDPSNQFHGMEISVSTNSSLPTYSEILNDIFHPNSNAILVYSQE